MMYELIARRNGELVVSELYATRALAEAAQFDIACDEWFDDCEWQVVRVPRPSVWG